MKTIYTDHFGIYHWAMLAVAVWQTVSACLAANAGDWVWATVHAGIAIVFFILAIRRMRQRRAALREGRDGSIIGTSER